MMAVVAPETSTYIPLDVVQSRRVYVESFQIAIPVSSLEGLFKIHAIAGRIILEHMYHKTLLLYSIYPYSFSRIQ